MQDLLGRRGWIEVGGVDGRPAPPAEKRSYELEPLVVGKEEVLADVRRGGVEDIAAIGLDRRQQIFVVLLCGIGLPPLLLGQGGVALDQGRDGGAALGVLLAALIVVAEAAFQVVGLILQGMHVFVGVGQPLGAAPLRTHDIHPLDLGVVVPRHLFFIEAEVEIEQIEPRFDQPEQRQHPHIIGGLFGRVFVQEVFLHPLTKLLGRDQLAIERTGGVKPADSRNLSLDLFQVRQRIRRSLRRGVGWIEGLQRGGGRSGAWSRQQRRGSTAAEKRREQGEAREPRSGVRLGEGHSAIVIRRVILDSGVSGGERLRAQCAMPQGGIAFDLGGPARVVPAELRLDGRADSLHLGQPALG